MEFGFSHHVTEDFKLHIQLAQLGEALGFHFFWFPDQTFFPDPYILLGLVALVTERIQIGLAVTNPHTRHPAISARSIGTLGRLAPGRVHIGIGAGNSKEVIHPLGLDSSHAGSKVQEMVEIIHGLLSGEKLFYHGRYFEVDGVALDFMPPQDIQIYIAGRGPVILKTAGEVADGVVIGALCNREGIDYALENVRIGALRKGRDISNMRIISWVTCILTDTRNQVLTSVKRSVAHIIGGAPDEVLEALGFDMELVRLLKTRYWSEGILEATDLVTDEFIDAFTIIGDAEYVISRIRMLQEAGVTQLSINLGNDLVGHHQARILAFAETIFPAFT